MTCIEIFQILGALFLFGLMFYAVYKMTRQPKIEHK